MRRVLTELNLEEEITAQMYISGMEKKEIADTKCRAISTVANQLQTVFRKMSVNNGRELCKRFYERVSGVTYTFDFGQGMRSAIACMLLGVFFLSMYQENDNMRRSRRARVEREERAERYREIL